MVNEPHFGIAPGVAGDLAGRFERFPGVERVWIYGSRARGDHRDASDIDLMVDAPDWEGTDFSRLWAAVDDLRVLYGVDLAHWQSTLSPEFRAQVERDRKVFWEPRRGEVALPRELGTTQLKKFQTEALGQLDRYLAELSRRKADSDNALAALRTNNAMEDMADVLRGAADFPKRTWDALRKADALPAAFAQQAHSSRWDGADRAIPNICLKVPTGGGKTLMAAASVGKVFNAYLNRHAGLVLWVVPNEAIYRQTLKTLKNRDHPYHQMLNVAGAGRVKILEKDSPLTRLDMESHLCVMLLMLASASRQSKETLRFFRDRGSVLGFTPREDDIEAHWKLLGEVPNLDAYGSPWASAAEARAQKGSVVKSSLGNVMRLVRPMVVIDEGHHAYTETALKTIDGFNPCFMLELSATPRVADPKAGEETSGSNILVDVRGTDLDEAEMIKLPIHVDVRNWTDWQSCLSASVEQLNALAREGEALQADTSRYIRPILLVQVERTGKDQTDPAYIHARDVREFLAQLGFSDAQIREKTSEKDEIGDEELLSPTSEVRVIITKQALQEGWDCPFAYVLCALAASKGKRAMTQLVGRILRLPQVAKTGRAALDACYVFCHAATTGEVVKAIKQSLEGEGMGDLPFLVHGDAGQAASTHTVQLKRRAGLDKLRIFVPKVTWAEPGVPRRELVYDSDVLARLPWDALDVNALAAQWKPGGGATGGGRVAVDLRVLDDEFAPVREALEATTVPLDRARIVRALLDLAPNAWLVWEWVDQVLQRLLRQWDERVVGGSGATLIEQLRLDIERERDRLAQDVFEQLVAEGRIEFRLRADRTDYELPHDLALELASKPKKLTRQDDLSDIEKSLLAPALRTPDLNEFEAVFAGYLDEQPALRWWHRNVAKTQYGLQGWKRHKVYPDFVFGFLMKGNSSRVVLLETKGAHLAGNNDTGYKQTLLARLTEAFCDERFKSAGELSLEEGGLTELQCDLVFDQAWRAAMDGRHFPTQT
ncbi:MAG: DEAD/DEAH box helicase family protein [Burkholderiaceae bacterium]